ncbi:MAG: N-acetylglucosamine-6-phosphate deacetylase, partial [Synergistaceae bacterium]|nr:N-acetylglucosamine-6-phosphate deacetylase [Synergistaceae bacterium]
MIIKGAKVFDERGGFAERDIYTDGEFITGSPRDGEILEAGGLYAIPGLVDIHTHGCMGFEFTSCPAEEMRIMTEYEASRGVTALCPTTLTLSEDALVRACGEISRGFSPDGASIVGINLEGPFISPGKLGAQNPDYVHAPDVSLFRRLQSASGGMVKMLAIAPELDGAISAIREISGEVVCSIAHTTADYDTAIEAFSAGARHVTHLYNAMPPFHHREPGVIGAVFDTVECRAEMICDGVHIHPSVVRPTFRMLGDDRVVMVSDSMMAAGLGDGEYELGGLPVKVSGNKATLVHGGSIAGSVTDLMGCLVTAVKIMGIPLHTAVKCAATNPAEAIG